VRSAKAVRNLLNLNEFKYKEQLDLKFKNISVTIIFRNLAFIHYRGYCKRYVFEFLGREVFEHDLI